jgi:formylmethanofuran dehydrogenase subunit C
MTITIESIAQAPAPIDVRRVSQEALMAASRREIERIAIHVGRNPYPLGEWFRVRGTSGSHILEWTGCLTNVNCIGFRLTGGEVHVHSAAGDLLGSQMQGGTIVIRGCVGRFLGQDMQGGQITVYGDAGDFAGGASAVSRYGLAGGKLLIHGHVGAHLGYRMRRGLLAVTGNAGDFAARRMLAGTIFLAGSCGRLPAAGMKRGTLLMPQSSVAQLPATFLRACRMRPFVVDLLLGSLWRSGFPGPESLNCCEMFSGDLLEGGRGEVITWTRDDSWHVAKAQSSGGTP